MRDGYYQNKQDFQDQINSAPNNQYFIKENTVMHGVPEGVERNIGNIGIDHIQRQERMQRASPTTRWNHLSPSEIEPKIIEFDAKEHTEFINKLVPFDVPLENIINKNMADIDAWEMSQSSIPDLNSQTIDRPTEIIKTVNLDELFELDKNIIIPDQNITPPDITPPNLYDTGMHPEMYIGDIQSPDINPPEIELRDLYMPDYQI